jgi:hypothetical protein
MVATTSAIGAGAQAACAPSAVRRAFITVWLAGMLPISKICVQR